MLIYMSYDAGVTWNLKSHYRIRVDLGTKNIIDNNHISFVASYVKFIKTTDAGITWIPQKNYESEYERSRYKDVQNFFKSFFKDNLFGLAYYDTDIQKEINFAYSDDGYETIKLKNSNEIIGYPLDGQVKMCLNNNQILFVQPSHFKANQFTIIYYLDNDLNATRRCLLDSMYVIFIDNFANNELFAIVKNFREYRIINNKHFYEKEYYSLLKSIDTAATWQKVIDFNFLDSARISSIISKLKEKIYFTSYLKDTAHFYQFNPITLEIKELFTRTDGWQTDPNGIIGVGSSGYINSVYFSPNGMTNELLYTEDLNNPNMSWKNITPSERYSSISLISKYDSLVFISAYDSLINSPTCWVAKPKNITSVELKTESKNYLFLSQPFPNPAQYFVKTKIYWNKADDINAANFFVYNLFGNIVSEKNQFQIEIINDYSAYLTWYCPNNISGVYFITICFENECKSIPVVLLKY